MPNIRRFLTRRLLLSVAALLFGLAMLHPYSRQSLFGPTIRGKPWCVWEAQIRWQRGELNEESFSGKLRRWLNSERPQPMSEDELFDHPEMVPLVVAMLDDPDPGVRSACMVAIIWFPCLRDRSSLPALRKWYFEDEAHLRLVAGHAIYQIEKDKEVLRWFVKLLDHADPEVRALAMGHVASLSADAPELYPHIVAHAKDSDQAVRRRVMEAMIHLGKKGVPTLIDGMNDADAGVRYGAALIAEQLGPDAKDAIAALEACLRDRDPSVPFAARSALRAIDPERYKYLHKASK
jgi:HEAT repeat protein